MGQYTFLSTRGQAAGCKFMTLMIYNACPNKDYIVCFYKCEIGIKGGLHIRVNQDICTKCVSLLEADYTVNPVCTGVVPYRVSASGNQVYVDFALCNTCCYLKADIYGYLQYPSYDIESYDAWIYTDRSACTYDCSVCIDIGECASQKLISALTTNRFTTKTLNTVSDINCKKNITPFNDGINILRCTDFIKFNYKDEKDTDLPHISIPANWTCQLISGEKQNTLRVNDALGVTMSAVKDIINTMSLWQKFKLWIYKKIESYKLKNKLKKKLGE